MVRGRLLALVLVTAVIGGAVPAGAATLTVTSGFDETNAGDGACSLREAILAVDSPGSANGDCAPAAFGANTIVLGPQSYFLGGFSAPASGELQIAPTVTSLTIVGASESKTAIDAGQLGNRVFEVAAGATLTLQDLTVTGGHASDGTAGPAGSAPGQAGGPGGPGENGGGIPSTPAR